MAINSIGSGYFSDYSHLDTQHFQNPEVEISGATHDLMLALQSAAFENVPEQQYHFLNPEVLARFSPSNQYDNYSAESLQFDSICDSISIGDGDSKGRGFMEYQDHNAYDQWEEPRPLWLSLYKLARSLFEQTDSTISSTLSSTQSSIPASILSSTKAFQSHFLSNLGTRLAFNPFI